MTGVDKIFLIPRADCDLGNALPAEGKLCLNEYDKWAIFEVFKTVFECFFLTSAAASRICGCLLVMRKCFQINQSIFISDKKTKQRIRNMHYVHRKVKIN